MALTLLLIVLLHILYIRQHPFRIYTFNTILRYYIYSVFSFYN